MKMFLIIVGLMSACSTELHASELFEEKSREKKEEPKKEEKRKRRKRRKKSTSLWKTHVKLTLALVATDPVKTSLYEILREKFT